MPPFAAFSSPHLGDHLLERLRALADAARLRARPGRKPRVLIVPGLPGTTLGRRGRVIDDTVWFCPEIPGRLVELAVEPGAPPLEPLTVMPAIYGQLKLRLVLAGYDVDDHPFDWRKSLDELGAQLAVRLAAEEGEVQLVAHSFGGLVCRAAIAAGALNVGKVIMLGTPNHGSWATVQGLRGRHWLLRALAELQVARTAEDLATQIFNTFPSVYDQLPTRAMGGAVDLYDPEAWPVTGPRPRAELLARAPGVQDWVAQARGRFTVIAGHGVPTVERVEKNGEVFRYGRTTDGDGWVTARGAALDDAPCYFTTAAHLAMTNDGTVLSAVVDLLAHDTTALLPVSRPEGAPLADQVDAAPGEHQDADLDSAELRDAVEQVLGIGAARALASRLLQE